MGSLTPRCLAFLDVFGNTPAISQASWWEDVGGRGMWLPFWSHAAELQQFPRPPSSLCHSGCAGPRNAAARRLKWRRPCSQHRSRRQSTSTAGRWFRRVNQQQPQRGLLPPTLWAKIMCCVHRRKSFSKVKPGQGRQEGTQYRLKLYLRTFLFWTRISLLKTKKASLSNKAFRQWNYCNQLF